MPDFMRGAGGRFGFKMEPGEMAEGAEQFDRSMVALAPRLETVSLSGRKPRPDLATALQRARPQAEGRWLDQGEIMSATQHCEKCGGPEPDLNVHPADRARARARRALHRALRAEVAVTKEYYLLV